MPPSDRCGRATPQPQPLSAGVSQVFGRRKTERHIRHGRRDGDGACAVHPCVGHVALPPPQPSRCAGPGHHFSRGPSRGRHVAIRGKDATRLVAVVRDGVLKPLFDQRPHVVCLEGEQTKDAA